MTLVAFAAAVVLNTFDWTLGIEGNWWKVLRVVVSVVFTVAAVAWLSLRLVSRTRSR